MKKQTKTNGKTAWTCCFAPDAASDRGWLKAICAPWSRENAYNYTSETMPVYDEEIGAWREQSTLGNYLTYSHSHGENGERVHCICYPTKTTKWVATVAEAMAWIEAEAYRARPELRGMQPLAA